MPIKLAEKEMYKVASPSTWHMRKDEPENKGTESDTSLVKSVGNTIFFSSTECLICHFQQLVTPCLNHF